MELPALDEMELAQETLMPGVDQPSQYGEPMLGLDQPLRHEAPSSVDSQYDRDQGKEAA